MSDSVTGTTRVLWMENDQGSLLLDPVDRRHATLGTLHLLRHAATLGEVRAVALPDWAQRIVASHVEHVEMDLEEDATDDRPWTWGSVSESVIEAVPLPWDPASLAGWLDDDVVAAHIETSGPGTPVAIGTYRARDRDALFDALREAGHELEHRPDLREEYYAAL